MIRAYYSVFTDIAQMWMDQRRAIITPGLSMLNALSAERDEYAMQSRAAELHNWSKSASVSCFRVAESVSRVGLWRSEKLCGVDEWLTT